MSAVCWCRLHFKRSQRNPLNPWLKEAEFHKQILEFLDAIRIEDDDIRDWFRAVLASKTWDSQAGSLGRPEHRQANSR